jgi:hypothetical protein
MVMDGVTPGGFSINFKNTQIYNYHHVYNQMWRSHTSPPLYIERSNGAMPHTITIITGGTNASRLLLELSERNEHE